MKPSLRSSSVPSCFRSRLPLLNRRTLLLGSAAGLLLPGCGGGGGGGGGGAVGGADAFAEGTGDTDGEGTVLPPPPVAEGPWTTPVALTTRTSLHASLLNIASNDAGDALAVWQESGAGGSRRLLGRRYRVGQGWETEHEIATTASLHKLESDVAMDAAGQAWVVWTQPSGNRFETWAMRHLATEGWQPAVRVDTSDDAVLATHARVSVDAQGSALVGWIKHANAAPSQVVVRPWMAGAGWGELATLNTDADTDPIELVLALGPQGRAVAGWIEARDAHPRVWAARWSLVAGAEPDAPITAVGSASDLHIASDASGVTLLAWRHVFAAAERVSTVRFPASGNAAAWVSRDNPAPGAVGRPQLDGGGAGQFALVWDELQNTRRHAWETRILDNDSATPGVLLENDGVTDAHHVQVALDATNQALAVWLRGAGSQGEVWAARQGTRNGWSAPERIAGETADASSLRLTGSAGGRALVAWLQPEAGVHRVWVQHRQSD